MRCVGGVIQQPPALGRGRAVYLSVMASGQSLLITMSLLLFFILNTFCAFNTSVPEENRNLAGRNFCANLTFSRKIAIFRKFRLGAQFLRKCGTLRFKFSVKVHKFCNLREIFTFSRKSSHF